MRFHTAAVMTTIFASALAIPQLAAAGCLSYNDVKTAHANVVDNGGKTEITLDGVCYNLVAKVYLGQQNGTLAQVIAPATVANNLNNQIVVTLPSLLPAGDYLVELRNNANAFAGSVFLTVPDLAASAASAPPQVFIARGDEVKRKVSENPFWFSPSGEDKSVKNNDSAKVGMRMPTACSASDLSAWAENTSGLVANDTIAVTLVVGANDALSCTITIGTNNDSCSVAGPYAVSAGDRIVFKATLTADSDGDKADVVTGWSCGPTPPAS